MVVITASKGDQFASWDEDAKLGLFTKHLLDALKGIADQKDVGGNGDGKVTLGEVKGYLDEEMTYQARRRFSRDQQATVNKVNQRRNVGHPARHVVGNLIRVEGAL